MSAVWITHVWLVVVWMALWGDLSVANLLGGIIAAFLATRIIPARPASGLLTVRPLALLRLGLYFVWKMVEASAIVAWEVVTPRNRIQEGIVAVPVRGITDSLTTLVANAVSLTPGTLTIDVIGDPPVLYVHVLHLKDIEAVRRDVLYLEMLAMRALAPNGSVGAAGASPPGYGEVAP